MGMRHTKPWDRSPAPDFDPLDDPNVHEWPDGSLWHVKDGSYQRLTSPVQETHKRGQRKENEWDWKVIIYAIILLLAIYGFVSLVTGLSNHSIDCHLGSSQGCYIYIPNR